MTLVKDLTVADSSSGKPASGATTLQIEQHAKPTGSWPEIYLAGLSADWQGVALRLVEGTPEPRVFFSAVRDGQVIASGLSVVDGPLASVQCMATTATARRTGAATAILGAIEAHAWASGVQRLYLQTDAANTTAISVYERFGFRLAWRYHTRELVA